MGIETEATIQQVLATAGTSLVFTFKTIKGIPQQELVPVSDYGSPYDMQKQMYSFLVSALDVYPDGLQGSSFTVTVYHRVFSFVVDSHTEDVTGWVEMQVSLQGISDV